MNAANIGNMETDKVITDVQSIIEEKGISRNTDKQHLNKQIINEPDIDFRRGAQKETVQCINAKSPKYQISDSVQEGCEQTTICTETTVTDLCSQHNINRNICDHLKGGYTQHSKHQNCTQHFLCGGSVVDSPRIYLLVNSCVLYCYLQLNCLILIYGNVVIMFLDVNVMDVDVR